MGDPMETHLKVFRAERDMTQEELADQIGVTRQTVIAMEKGNYNPSLELAFKIARLFNAKIEDIFIYEE
jgi:putative transcriptional regulator